MRKCFKLAVAHIIVSLGSAIGGEPLDNMFISENIFALEDGFVWEAIDRKMPNEVLEIDGQTRISTNYEKEWQARLELDQYPIVPHQAINVATGDTLRCRLVGRTDFERLSVKKGLLTKHPFELKRSSKRQVEMLLMHHIELKDGKFYSALVENLPTTKRWEAQDTLVLIQKDRSRQFLLNLDKVSLIDTDLLGTLFSVKILDNVVEAHESKVVFEYSGECTFLHYPLLPYPQKWEKYDEVIISRFLEFFDEKAARDSSVAVLHNITRNDLAFALIDL